MFKYLTFVICAAKAPIRQKMLDETISRVAKAGDFENIQRWCFWTPSQLSLMEMAEKLPRVILIGGCGTGKTVMLDAFATIMAKNQKGCVIFAIQNNDTDARPLLEIDLEVNYEKLKLKNILVTTFEEIEELKNTESDNTTIIYCLDEIDISHLDIYQEYGLQLPKQE